jgi:hypothetical protein
MVKAVVFHLSTREVHHEKLIYFLYVTAGCVKTPRFLFLRRLFMSGLYKLLGTEQGVYCRHCDCYRRGVVIKATQTLDKGIILTILHNNRRVSGQMAGGPPRVADEPASEDRKQDCFCSTN